MKSFLYKWLPIIFGCHCRRDRSFVYKGNVFPICARCSGECLGLILGIIGWFILRFDGWIYGMMMIPMVVDGLLQMLSPYESHNVTRLITGIMFGYGLISLFILSHYILYDFAQTLKTK